MDTTRVSPGEGNLGPEGSGMIWSALVHDANVGVVVVDADGVVAFANTIASKLYSKGAPIPPGQTLRELGGEEFARERLDVVRDVLASGRVLALEGMVSARYLRTVFRPLPPDAGGRRRVLLISRVASPGETKAEGAPTAIRSKHDDSGVLAGLTGREMEILKLIGAGLSTAQIAKKLHRSVKTVEWHRVSLGNKLGVTNRVELARIAIGAGLVDAEVANAAGEN